jgi:hypothetical protein
MEWNGMECTGLKTKISWKLFYENGDISFEPLIFIVLIVVISLASLILLACHEGTSELM